MIFLDKRLLYKNHTIIKTPAQIPTIPAKNNINSNISQYTIYIIPPAHKDARRQIIYTRTENGKIIHNPLFRK